MNKIKAIIWKIRRIDKKKTIYRGLIIIVLFMMLRSNCKKPPQTYDYIETDSVLKNMHAELAKNFTSSAITDCEYQDTILDNSMLSPSLVDGDLIESHKILEGGEYAPTECKPRFSTAIIVPYRDRAEQLRGFLVYMHTFLRRQRIHYRIYVVEQVDAKPFNRAKLMNIGAKAAMRAGFPCLILHDVDLLPLRPANLYACTECPRHMSSCIDKLRFVLPYVELIGGALAVVSSQYKDINGMSNQYFGWGGEDDDMYVRLEEHNLKVCRFEPQTSQYHMLKHVASERPTKVQYTKVAIMHDGLTSLKYTEIVTVLHPLFTHIVVDL